MKPRHLHLFIDSQTGTQYRIVRYTDVGLWHLESRESQPLRVDPLRLGWTRWRILERRPVRTDLTVHALEHCGFEPVRDRGVDSKGTGR